MQVFQLEQHCKNLEGELESVKDEILKIISDKTSKSKENESLKHYVKAYEDLRQENESLKKELALIKISNPPKSPALSTSSKSSSGSSTTENIDRSSPDGQEFDLVSTTSSTTSTKEDNSSKDDDSKALLDDAKAVELQKEVDLLKEKHEKESAALEGKVKELEESLELMKNEFENMEDYWQVIKLLPMFEKTILGHSKVMPSVRIKNLLFKFFSADALTHYSWKFVESGTILFRKFMCQGRV